MSGTQNSTPVFETAAQFKTALARALMAVAKEQAVSSTRTADVMTYLGLPRPRVTASVTDFEIPEIPEPETIDGRPLSAYKASYLAEHNRRELWVARSSAYSNLEYERGNRLSEASVIKVCEAVGLPVPALKTSVSVKVKGLPNAVSFTIDGKLSEEQKAEIVTRFEQLAVDPAGDVVRDLFPEVEGLPAKVTLTSYTSHVWPVFPAYEEQGEGSSTGA